MDKDNLSVDDILAIDDFSDCFDTADLLGIGMDGLDSVEEMKERLTMEWLKCQPDFVNYKDKICREMKDVRIYDISKREKLLELLNKTKSKLVKGDADSSEKLAVIHEALQKENVVTNLTEDIDVRQKWLQSNECCFVVAGETSAGKSLFLNLLLGEMVLPSHLLPCTSVITRLSYSKRRETRIIYHDPDRPPQILNDVTADDIRESIFEKDIMRRESTGDIKEVQIFLPSKILEHGLVLIDSPGIGENESMDTVIEKFVDSNQVMGFIYVLKSDNGGGVDEDRLIKLMKIILEKEKEKSDKHSYRFDPSCAMFVCNIWDEVTEPEKVYNHIVHRLGKIWPQFDEGKVITFSTRNALRETTADPDYIIEDYQNVLKVLHVMNNMALDSQIKTSYNWIKTILMRSAKHVKTMVKRLSTGQNRMGETLKEANENLKELHNKSTTIITTLRHLITMKTDEVCSEFREYLSEPVVKMAIQQWIAVELPTEKDEHGHQKDWATIKYELDGLIYDRIAEELNKWEDDNSRIWTVESFVEYEIKQKLGCLTNEIDDVESNKIKETEDSELRNSQRESRRISIVQESTTSIQRRGSFCIGNSKDASSTQEKHVHISVVAQNKIYKPFRMIRSLLPGKNNIKEYTDNKVNYAKKRSIKLLKQFLEPRTGEEDQLKNVIKTFMNGAKEFLDKLVLKIPRSIDANKSVLSHVASFQRNAVSARRIYEQMMDDLEELKRLLGYYGSGYIFIDDFKPNELHILDPTDGTGRTSTPFKISDFLTNLSTSQTTLSQPCPRGLWTAYQKGLLQRKNGNEPVSIKVYLPSCKMEKHVKEIAKLRLIADQKNIARFLGIQNSDSYYPALVYEQHLNTLRRYSLKRSGKIETSRILRECGEALDFLHSNGLVHMEFNLNTIMINSTGSIKLTGGCLPRKADLPENPEQHIIGDFVYLSPEALKGDLYTATADVYAYGLLLFDLVSDAPAFVKQRQMSLDLFIRKINSDTEMRPEIDLLDFTESGKSVIASCLVLSEGSRPLMSQLLGEIAQMEGEHCFEHVKTSRNSSTFVKRIDYGRV